jgi:hypothetical protein
LKLLLRTQRGHELLEKIERIREGTESLPSASQAITGLHEKED